MHELLFGQLLFIAKSSNQKLARFRVSLPFLVLCFAVFYQVLWFFVIFTKALGTRLVIFSFSLVSYCIRWFMWGRKPLISEHIVKIIYARASKDSLIFLKIFKIS